MNFTSSFFRRFLHQSAGVAAVAIAATWAMPQVARADAQDDFFFQFAQQRYFHRAPQTARTIGLSYASIPTAQDSSSVIGNPAGLAWMQDAELQGTYTRDEVHGRNFPNYAEKITQDIDGGNVLLAVPLGPNLDDLPNWGNLGLGWSTTDSDVDDSLDTTTDQQQVHFAYAKALNSRFSLGYGLTYVNDEFENDFINYEMEDGYRHNFGAQWWANENFGVGALFYFAYGDPNAELAGAKTDLETDARGFEIGASWRRNRTLVVASADYNNYETDDTSNRFGFGPNAKEEGDDFAFKVGIEQGFWREWLKGRIGYRYQGNQDYEIKATGSGDTALDGSAKYNALSLGVGAELGRYLRVDYGVEMRFIGDENDVLHAVSATVPFSLCREDWARN